MIHEVSELMQERYGSADPRRRVVLIAATTVLAVVFLGWLGWAAFFHASPAIDAAVTRFDVVDEHLVKVQVTARFDGDDVRGSCLLRATARDHTPVGDLNLTETELRENAGTWIEVRTERLATAVELVRCVERDS
jgi:hypothetical protein